MEDNEIIKALENEIHLVEYVDGFSADNVSLELLQNSLELINRQQTEIERLKKYNTEVAYKHYNDGINDGIKEFANRLKDKSLTKWDYHDAVDIAEIDNLVKEMTEGKPCTEDADCSTCEYCYFDGEYNECAVNGIKPIIRNWRGKI